MACSAATESENMSVKERTSYLYLLLVHWTTYIWWLAGWLAECMAGCMNSLYYYYYFNAPSTTLYIYKYTHTVTQKGAGKVKEKRKKRKKLASGLQYRLFWRKNKNFIAVCLETEKILWNGNTGILLGEKLMREKKTSGMQWSLFLYTRVSVKVILLNCCLDFPIYYGNSRNVIYWTSLRRVLPKADFLLPPSVPSTTILKERKNRSNWGVKIDFCCFISLLLPHTHL